MHVSDNMWNLFQVNDMLRINCSFKQRKLCLNLIFSNDSGECYQGIQFQESHCLIFQIRECSLQFWWNLSWRDRCNFWKRVKEKLLKHRFYKHWHCPNCCKLVMFLQWQKEEKYSFVFNITRLTRLNIKISWIKMEF